MESSCRIISMNILIYIYKKVEKSNLLVSPSFSIYMCMTIYNSKDRNYNTGIMPIIFFIYTFYNMSHQAEGGGSTRNLKRKAVKKAVESGLVKTFASWS